MGVIRKLFTTTILGGAGSAGAFAFWTRNSHFVPLHATDPIFTSKAYKFQNPNANPATQDLCERRVPLSRIQPSLLEKAPQGALVEAFCAGLWSGLGYAYQRRFLEKKYRSNPQTAHQLWDTVDLRTSKYEVGTEITDHFQVVEKDVNPVNGDGKITVRCGDSPLVQGVRSSDGLFEMSVRIDKEKGDVVFGLKSVLFKGLGKVEGKNGPMPPHIEFLHRVYVKLWMETAVSNVVM